MLLGSACLDAPADIHYIPVNLDEKSPTADSRSPRFPLLGSACLDAPADIHYIPVNLDEKSPTADSPSPRFPEPVKRSYSLRAVHTSHLVAHMGEVFDSHSKPVSEEAAEHLFSMSVETPVVHHFVSHSWRGNRFLKWAALVDYYHKTWALFLGNIWWLVASGLAAYCRLQGKPEIDFRIAYLIFNLLPCLIVCSVMVFGQSCIGNMAHVGSLQFLDRVCIHQWDDELKELGVKSLGQVLQKSEKMMLLWSPDYFERMWCVFEVASFAAAHHRSVADIIVLPLWQPPLVFGMLVGNMIVLLVYGLLNGTIFAYLIETFGVNLALGVYWAAANAVPACVICVVIHNGVAQKIEMERAVANFSFSDAKLSVATDREFILNQVRQLFGTLEAFEQFVRNDFLQMLQESVRSAGDFPYAWGAIACLPYLWYMATDSVSMSSELARAQGCPDWLHYAVLNVISYSAFFLCLPFALKSVAFTAVCSSSLPAGISVCISIFVFLSAIFLLATLCMAASGYVLSGVVL